MMYGIYHKRGDAISLDVVREEDALRHIKQLLDDGEVIIDLKQSDSDSVWSVVMPQ